MNQSPETLFVQSPEERAERFARAITNLVISQTVSHETILPNDPNYTVVLDDPRGDFPLQYITPLHIRVRLNGPEHDIYATPTIKERAHKADAAVAQYTPLTLLSNLGRLPFERLGLSYPFSKPSTSQRAEFVFQGKSLKETLQVIRPIDDPKYLNIG